MIYVCGNAQCAAPEKPCEMVHSENLSNKNKILQSFNKSAMQPTFFENWISKLMQLYKPNRNEKFYFFECMKKNRSQKSDYLFGWNFPVFWIKWEYSLNRNITAADCDVQPVLLVQSCCWRALTRFSITSNIITFDAIEIESKIFRLLSLLRLLLLRLQ